MARMKDLLICRREGWEALHVGEIWAHRELLYFLVWRDIKIRYKQTVLGGLWAILQPLLGAIVFASVLQRVGLSGVPGVPFILFTYTGLVLWTFFANSVSMAGSSMVGNEQLIRKVYFPRVLIPLASVTALLLDLLVGAGFLGLIMLFYQWTPPTLILLTPVFALCAFFTASGIGMVLAALNVQFRDIKYVIPFLLQIGLFVTPIFYPLSHAEGGLRLLLSLNPMAGIVEGWRGALLGTPVLWPIVLSAMVASVVLFVAGLFFLQRKEREFADVI